MFQSLLAIIHDQIRDLSMKNAEQDVLSLEAAADPNDDNVTRKKAASLDWMS